MSAISEHPYEWLRRIEEAVASLDQKPQFGGVVPFPWEGLQAAFRKLFQKPDLLLFHHPRGWTPPEKLWEGMGNNVYPQALFLSPLNDFFYFVMDKQDVEGLMTELLGGKEESGFFFENDYVEGFYQYLTLEIANQVTNLKVFEGLSPKVGEVPIDIKKTLAEQTCFLVDVTMQFDSKAFYARVFIPSVFRDSWKKYHAEKPKPPFSKELAQKLSVDIALEAGKSHLAWGEWKELREGDFLILDRCSIDPQQKKGRVTLTVEGHPIFRANITGNGIKLLEYPLIEEGEANMEKDENAFEEDESFYGDLENEDEGEEEDEEEFADLLKKVSRKKEKQELLEEEKEEPQEEAKLATTLLPSEEITPLAPEKLPIQVIIEVGKIRLSVQELMDLSPGNFLTLPVTPEEGVNLVVNGKKVGRGELVKMGEVLGVRILQL